jgi:hypothetical protein
LRQMKLSTNIKVIVKSNSTGVQYVTLQIKIG